MSETLQVNNFLTIKDALFEFKKINVVIGKQAVGKSLIAKLTYFFKSDCIQILLKAAELQQGKREIDKQCLTKFKQLFPEYTWKADLFTIRYTFGDYSIEIANQLTPNRKRPRLTITISKTLLDIHRKLNRAYKQAIKQWQEENPEREQNFRRAIYSLDILRSTISDLDEFNRMGRAVFIPANRAFFSTLSKNVFSLLAQNIEIDIFLREFGAIFEHTKNLHSIDSFLHRNDSNKLSIDKVNHLVEEIISGSYQQEDGEDWIVSRQKKVKLANASSGQQEAVPMLFILSFLPFLESNPRMFFIEEPEAHLFPTAQKKIVSILSIIANTQDHPVFMTTHSPYILTAINNLILASDTYQKVQDRPDKAAQVLKIVDQDQFMRYSDVAAYTLENGTLTSIMNSENRLIGENIIDSVSDEFSAQFDQLLDIYFEDQ